MKRWFFVLLMSGLLLSACGRNSGPIKDAPLTAKAMDDARIEEQLTEEERRLLDQYVMSLAMSEVMSGQFPANPTPDDYDQLLDGSVTIREAIEAQRRFQESQALRRQQQEREFLQKLEQARKEQK